MKTKYKHIHFEQSEHPVASWICRANRTNVDLGYVYIYSPWKCYVFGAKDDCMFDTSCLADIIDFMNQLKP